MDVEGQATALLHLARVSQDHAHEAVGVVLSFRICIPSEDVALNAAVRDVEELLAGMEVAGHEAPPLLYRWVWSRDPVVLQDVGLSSGSYDGTAVHVGGIDVVEERVWSKALGHCPSLEESTFVEGIGEAH